MIDQFADLAERFPRWARVFDGVTRTWAHRHQAREALDRHPHRRFARAALRRHIHMRDRTCTFPGCRRPAGKSDLDHTNDHGCGGTTTDRNSGPLCGIHHEIKTRGIWRQQQTSPGRFTWTSPLGCTYRTRGEPVIPDLPEPPKPPPLRPPPLPLPEDPPF